MKSVTIRDRQSGKLAIKVIEHKNGNIEIIANPLTHQVFDYDIRDNYGRKCLMGKKG